jgi:predicted nucleic acid-binding Zn ribbon protein
LGVPDRVDPRRAILAQWRGIDLAPAERAAASSAQAVKTLMPKVLADLGLERRCAETEIIKVWNHSLDPNIVAHAQPSGLRKGTLFVNVDSNAWLSEIVRYRRREILDRLQHSFGRQMIVRISFRVG